MRCLTHIGTEIGKNLDTHTREAGHVPPALGKKNNPGHPEAGAFSIPSCHPQWQAITAGGRFLTR
jgi:hypothetical protein